MKNILYFLIIICFYNTSLSQEVDFKTTKLQITKVNKQTAAIDFIAKTNNKETIVVRSKPTNAYTYKVKYYISIYNKNAKLVKEGILKTKSVDEIFTANDSLCFLSKTIDTENTSLESTSNIIYKCNVAAIHNLVFKEKTVLNKPKQTYYNQFKGFNSDNPNHFVYASIQKVSNQKPIPAIPKLTITSKTGKSKIYKSILKYDTYNNHLTLTDSAHFLIENNIHKKINVEQHIFDDQNNAHYFLVFIKDKKQLHDRTTSNNLYYVIKFKNNIVSKTKLINSEVKLETIKIKLYKNQIICGGMYSKTYNDYMDGFFKINFSKDRLNTISETFTDFTETFLEDWVKSHKRFNVKKNKKSSLPLNHTAKVASKKFKDLQIRDIVINENGDCNLHIQEFYIMQEATAPEIGGVGGIPLAGNLAFTASSTSGSTRNSKSIILAKINNQNKLVWSRCIPNKPSADYIYKYYKNTHYFFHNKSPKFHHYYIPNNDDTPNENVYLHYYKVDENGQLTSFNFKKHIKDSNSKITIQQAYNLEEEEDLKTLFLHMKNENVFQLNELQF